MKTPVPLDQRCRKTGVRDGTLRGHRCHKAAKFEGWCSAHYLPNVEKRQQEWQDNWQKKWDDIQQRHAKTSAIRNAEDKVIEEALKAAGGGWVYSLHGLVGAVDALKKARE